MAFPTYYFIASQDITSTQSSVTFSSIPATYTDLVLVCSIKWTSSGASSFGLTFNSDTNANYRIQRFYGQASSVTQSRETSKTNTATGQMNSGNWTTNVLHIPGYKDTTHYKLVLGRCDIATGQEVGIFTGLWVNTAAITSLVVGYPDSGVGGFASGSSFNLYGIKGNA